MDVDALVERLIKRWKAAKVETDKSTKPLLRLRTQQSSRPSTLQGARYDSHGDINRCAQEKEFDVYHVLTPDQPSCDSRPSRNPQCTRAQRVPPRARQCSPTPPTRSVPSALVVDHPLRGRYAAAENQSGANRYRFHRNLLFPTSRTLSRIAASLQVRVPLIDQSLKDTLT